MLLLIVVLFIKKFFFFLYIIFPLLDSLFIKIAIFLEMTFFSDDIL